jgi:TonB family protein
MRTRFLVGVSLISLALATGGQLRAQSQDAVAAAKEVVAALPGDELVRAALENAAAQQAGSRPGAGDSTTRAAIWARLQGELVTFYASAFTAAELHEIATFYRTPTGRLLAVAQVPIAFRVLAASRGGTLAQRAESTSVATAPTGAPSPTVAQTKAPTDSGASRSHTSDSTVVSKTEAAGDVAQPSDANVDYFWIQVEKPAAELPGNPEPVYPDSLRKAGVTGDVVVQFVVDTAGQVDTSRVLVSRSSGEPFTAAVRAILPQLRYTPAEYKGHKVRQFVDKRFVFPARSPAARDSTPPTRDSTPPARDSTAPVRDSTSPARDSTPRSSRDSTPPSSRDSTPRSSRDSTPPPRDSTPPSP